MAERFDPRALQRFAQRFDRATFERRFAETVEEARQVRGNTNGTTRATGRASTNGASTNAAAHANGVTNTHATTRNGAVMANGAPRANGARNGNGKIHLPMVSLPDGASPAGGAVQRNGHKPAFNPFPILEHPSASPAAGLATKRVVDIALGASALMITAPLVAALAAVIPLDSPGSAFFCQRRIGLHQRPFTMIKLRTMDAQGRVTRLGRMLRPTGLDELPQLWNVLRGDMSLIGPRPEVIERVARFENDLPGFGTRHLIRPGITGWAQVNGLRGNVSIAERLRFDIQYVRERSLALDGRILMRTVSTVLIDTLRELGG